MAGLLFGVASRGRPLKVRHRAELLAGSADGVVDIEYVFLRRDLAPAMSGDDRA